MINKLHLPSRTHQPQYGSLWATQDLQSVFWWHVCTGTFVIYAASKQEREKYGFILSWASLFGFLSLLNCTCHINRQCTLEKKKEREKDIRAHFCNIKHYPRAEEWTPWQTQQTLINGLSAGTFFSVVMYMWLWVLSKKIFLFTCSPVVSPGTLLYTSGLLDKWTCVGGEQ